MLKVLGRFAAGMAIVAGAVGAGAGLALLPVGQGTASAATVITVNDFGDGTPVPGNCVLATEDVCTLRAALEEAPSLTGDVTINLPAGDYTPLSDNGQLQVEDPSGGAVSIVGADQSTTFILMGCSESCPVDQRVMKIDPGDTATISNVTIEDGNVTSGTTGGGILDCFDLTLIDATVTGNSAPDGGGGVAVESGGTLNFTDATVSHNTQAGGGDNLGGGGVYVQSSDSQATTVNILGTLISDNHAVGDGGGVEIGGAGNLDTVVTIGDTDADNTRVSGNTVGDGANGAGLAQGVTSTLNATDANFTDNGPTTEGDSINGGGLWLDGSDSADTINGGVIDSNGADNGAGAYIFGAVDPDFTDVTITNNTAVVDGGGVYLGNGTNTFTGGSISSNEATGDMSHDGEGGGVYIDDGTNSFTGVDISENEVTSDFGEGGGVFINNGTNAFTGGSITENTLSGEDGEGGGVEIDDGTNAFNGVAVTDNVADGDGEGGGFYIDDGTNTITGGSIDGNSAYDGGGANLDDGDTTLSQVDISDNTASEGGAGLFVWTDGPSATVTQSTISDNSVDTQIKGGSPFLGDGGGILSCNGQDITLTNDTITGNSAPINGGGYYATTCQAAAGPIQPNAHAHTQPHSITESTTSFLFDTVTDNSTGNSEGGGNIQVDDFSKVTLAETIVAGGIVGTSPTTNCAVTDESGSITSLGHNLIDDTTCGTPGTGDIIGQSPQLGALGDNGGPTSTELPANGSPAIGGVPAGVCSGTGVNTDQRGVTRPSGVGGSCTIGAVEVVATAPPSVNLNGYRLVANEGGIFDFGLNFHGSLANNHLNAPIVGIANSPGYDGYLMAGADGGVFALGGANFYGSLGGTPIPSPIAAIAAPPTENGYWLASQNGTIYNYGASPALPPLSVPAGAHIVGMASTQDGGGAWLTDNLGDVYAEGDAQFVGGMGGVALNQPIVGIAAAAHGQGYVLAAADGGAFVFGTQGFFGSVPGSLAPGQHLVAPIVGIAVTHSGNGYWFVGADGGVFNYGDAPFLGSIYTAIGNHPLNGPIVGVQHLGELPTA